MKDFNWKIGQKEEPKPEPETKSSSWTKKGTRNFIARALWRISTFCFSPLCEKNRLWSQNVKIIFHNYCKSWGFDCFVACCLKNWTELVKLLFLHTGFRQPEIEQENLHCYRSYKFYSSIFNIDFKTTKTTLVLKLTGWQTTVWPGAGIQLQFLQHSKK